MASSETKEDCSWNHFAAEDGHHKWFLYSQVSTHFLTWEWDLLHLSKDFLLQRLLQPCGTEPEAVTCTWQCPLSSEKKKLLDYPTLNSTCRWCCWHFCHQSIHQLIEFTSTRLHKRLHNNMVKVKTVPVPQPKTKQKTTRISAVMTLWVPVTRYHQRKAREHGMPWKNIPIRTPLIH